MAASPTSAVAPVRLIRLGWVERVVELALGNVRELVRADALIVV
jgi:hypothetical protein